MLPVLLLLLACVVDMSRCCSIMIAGRGATSDGSILMSYQNDLTGRSPFHLKPVGRLNASEATQPRPSCASAKILPVPEGGTIPYVTIAMDERKYNEGGLNEAGLAINFGTWVYARPEPERVDPLVDTGVSFELWDIILQRCRTAREAADTFEALLLAGGASSGVLGSVGFANAHEAWVFEMICGHHWAAHRVPDWGVLAHPNLLRIGEVVRGDREHYRASPGLEEFARSLGYPADKPFRFDNAFNDPKGSADGPRDRLWSMLRLYSPSLGFERDAPWDSNPTFVRPDERVTPASMRAVQRNHHEGTDLIKLAGENSPHTLENLTDLPAGRKQVQPICRYIATYHVVWKLSERRSVMMIGTSEPCSTVQIPVWAESVAEFARPGSEYSMRLPQREQIAAQELLDAGTAYRDHIGAIHGRQAPLDRQLDAAVLAAEELGCNCSAPSAEWPCVAAAAGEDGIAAKLAELTTWFSDRAVEFTQQTLRELRSSA